MRDHKGTYLYVSCDNFEVAKERVKQKSRDRSCLRPAGLQLHDFGSILQPLSRAYQLSRAKRLLIEMDSDSGYHRHGMRCVFRQGLRKDMAASVHDDEMYIFAELVSSRRRSE